MIVLAAEACISSPPPIPESPASTTASPATIASTIVVSSAVWYAPAEYREFFWVSSPEATHSRNLAVRPQLAIVIFDSHEARGWKALYMSAVAEQLADVDEGIGIFSRRSVEQGLPVWTREDVLPPARHRFYRATASEHLVLDPHDQRIPVNFA